ncbi:unnamed protein product [Linum trigynum]|uniref:rRNA-processing protein EBP2 homolog n=1 Tax=Linum trigynum TaxID=586398 RepID=A0AAV2G612_9ROSI
MGTPKLDSDMDDVEPMEGEVNGEFTDSDSDSGEEDIQKSAIPSKDAVYNRDGMNDKLQEISWPENLGWIHKLSLDINQEQDVDVNDDLTREMAFYTQALEGERRALEKFETMGLPFLRPPDYYAEMVKSDTHMQKVKSRLLAEERNMEEARDSNRLAKEVQAQKQKERATQKKSEIEAAKKWRKQRQQNGFPAPGGKKNGDEIDLDFGDGLNPFAKSNKQRPGVSPGDRSGGSDEEHPGDLAGVLRPPPKLQAAVCKRTCFRRRVRQPPRGRERRHLDWSDYFFLRRGNVGR